MCFIKRLFDFQSCVDSFLTVGKKQWPKLAATFENPTQQINSAFAVTGSFFLFFFFWGGGGAYFCMGVTKQDVVAVIKMGAYIHGTLINFVSPYW